MSSVRVFVCLCVCHQPENLPYQTVPDSIRQYQTVPDSTRQCQTVPDSTGQYMTVHDRMRQYKTGNKCNANEYISLHAVT